MRKSTRETLNSPFILKLMDLANTILANPIAAGGLVAMATIPIEDWWRATHEDPGIKNPIAGIRDIMLAAITAHAAAGAIPAIADLAKFRAASGETSLIARGLPYP